MRNLISRVSNTVKQAAVSHRNGLYKNVLVLWLAAELIYCSAVIELIICQRPVNDILTGFQFSIWMPSWVSTPLLYHCAITLAPLLSILIILFSECALFHHPWSNGKLDCSEFRQAENIQRFIQYFTYALCATHIYLAFTYDKFVQTPLCMIVAVSRSLPLTICILQGAYRLTFRRMANWAIAIVNTLLYLTLLDCACIGEKILGLFGSATTRTELASTLNHLPDPIKTGIVATVVIIILKDSITTFLSDITSRHPSNLAQRRRYNRRRLLTHWHYKKDATISSLENVTVAFLVFESILFAVAAIWVLVATGYARELVDASDNPPLIPFDLYLLGLALLIFIPSIMSIWTISDERLIQSEYSFLTNRAPLLHPRDIKESSTHWLDFCQVLVNLYNNVSGIESEDRGYHDLRNFLDKLHKHLGGDDLCSNIRFFSDILGFKSDINAKLLRDSSHEEADDTNPQHQNSTMIQRARDVQFSHQLLALLKARWETQEPGEKPKPLPEQDPLFMIMDISTAFFTADNSVWGLRFAGYSLTAEEASRLLQMDTLLHILRHDNTTKCCLHKYGCHCPGVCPADKNTEEDDAAKKEAKKNQLLQRIELSILYPLLVIKCYELRWGKSVSDEAFRMKIVDYYQKLILNKYSLGNDWTGKDIDQLLDMATLRTSAHWLDESLLLQLMTDMERSSGFGPRAGFGPAQKITIYRDNFDDSSYAEDTFYIFQKMCSAKTSSLRNSGSAPTRSPYSPAAAIPPTDKTPSAASVLSRATVSDSVYQNLLYLIHAIYYPTKEDAPT